MPLRVGERTIGDHLKENGIQSVLVGKTHMVADAEGMAWLGICLLYTSPSPRDTG